MSLHRGEKVIIKPFSMQFSLTGTKFSGSAAKIVLSLDAPITNALLRMLRDTLEFLDTGELPLADFFVDFTVDQMNVALILKDKKIGRIYAGGIVAKSVTRQDGVLVSQTSIATLEGTQTFQGEKVAFLTNSCGATIDYKGTSTEKITRAAFSLTHIHITPLLCQLGFSFLDPDPVVPIPPPPPKRVDMTFIFEPLVAHFVPRIGEDTFMRMSKVTLPVIWLTSGELDVGASIESILGYAVDQRDQEMQIISVPSDVNVTLTGGVVKATLPEMELSGNWPMFRKITTAAIDILFSTDDPNGPIFLTYGINVAIEHLFVNLYPYELQGPHSRFAFERLLFVLKAANKLGYLVVSSVSVSVSSAVTTKALEISSIELMLSFEEGDEIVSFQDIFALPDDPKPPPFTLNLRSFCARIANIRINYSHPFARAVILAVFPKDASAARELVNTELVPLTDSTGTPMSPPKGRADVGTLDVYLYLINSLGSIHCTDIGAAYTDGEWQAAMKTFEIFPANRDAATRSLIESPSNSSLIDIHFGHGVFRIALSEFTFNIDFVFYRTLTNFILRTPFFHIPDILSDTSTPSSAISLPFTL
jgi:hypothetical protein